MYFSHILMSYSLQNNLQKEVYDYLKTMDRRVIATAEIENFKNEVLTGIRRLELKHPRCKSLDASWSLPCHDGDKDYRLYFGAGSICCFHIYAGQENNLNRPKIVCLCGSTRFMEAFQQANLLETLAGNIVLSVGCNTKSDAELFGNMLQEDLQATKQKLDDLHKRKIDMADEVLILNVGGYVGESTRSELEYAKQLGKTVRFLEPITEPWHHANSRMSLETSHY